MLDIDLMFAYEALKELKGPGFVLMSSASRSKIKNRKDGSVEGIDVVNLIIKYRQRVVDGDLKQDQDSKFV